MHRLKNEALNEAQWELATRASSIAAHVAGRWAKLYPRHADDIKSSADLGAVMAAASYDPNRDGAAWQRWVEMHARYSILDFLGTLKRDTPSVPGVDLEMVIDPHSVGEPENPEELAEKLLDGLPPRHRTLCRLVYCEGMDIDKAGCFLGWSRYQSYQLHSQAMEMLKRVKQS